jgi:hypothetical protein
MEIFGLDVLKSALLILAMILYWKFVYYKHHTEDITPISMILAGGCLVVYGSYSWLKLGSVSFSDISVLAHIFLLLALISFFILILELRKHGFVKDVDITLTWIKRNFGEITAYLCILLVLPVYVMIMFGTYSIFGKEHVVLWAMVILAWIKSNIVLLRKNPLKSRG